MTVFDKEWVTHDARPVSQNVLSIKAWTPRLVAAGRIYRTSTWAQAAPSLSTLITASRTW